MTIGPVDGPQTVQWAAEAQRWQRQAGEMARGEEASRRFAAELERARRQRQVVSASADAEPGRVQADPRRERRHGWGSRHGRQDAGGRGRETPHGRRLQERVGLDGAQGDGLADPGAKGVYLDRRT